MSRISEDVSKVRMYVGPALMYSINTLTLFIIVISYMFSVSPRLFSLYFSSTSISIIYNLQTQ